MEDLRTEKEILHNMENRIDEINFYLWGKGEGKLEGKNIKSPYGETTLRGRIGNNVEKLINSKVDAYQLNMLNRLSDIQDSLEKDTLTIGQFLIVLGIVLAVFSGLLTWILLT